MKTQNTDTVTNISTTPYRMTARDLKILRAMQSNIRDFLESATKRAKQVEKHGVEIFDVEVTFISKEF